MRTGLVIHDTEVELWQRYITDNKPSKGHLAHVLTYLYKFPLKLTVFFSPMKEENGSGHKDILAVHVQGGEAIHEHANSLHLAMADNKIGFYQIQQQDVLIPFTEQVNLLRFSNKQTQTWLICHFKKEHAETAKRSDTERRRTAGTPSFSDEGVE